MAELEHRLTHSYAQTLGFVGSGDGAAVVVGEHDHRTALQVGPEYPLAADKEVVAVGQCVHCAAAFKDLYFLYDVADNPPDTQVVPF